jgi:hypothetical protein
MVKDEDDDRAQYSDEHAVDIETGNTFSAEESKQPSPNNRTHYAKDNVENESLAALIDNFAGDEAGNKP